MVTIVVNVNGAEVAVNDGYRKIQTGYGLSTDTKPTKGFENADRFVEMDTGDVYLFDEQNATWLPM